MDLDDERQAEELDRQQYEQSMRVMENFDPGDYLIDDDLGDYLIDDDDYYDPNGEPCWQCWSTVETQKWPPHDKTNKMTCAPSEDSDQPGHPPSLIRVFVVRSIDRQAPKVSSCGKRRL